MIIAIVIVLIIGNSFGFFQYAKEGEVVNFITIKGITVEILNKEADALNLTNAYPMYDEEGMKQIPFTFTFTNNSSNNSISYSMRVVIDEEKMNACKLEDGTTCPQLDTKYIKYSYQKNDGSYSEPKLLSSQDGLIDSSIIRGDETIKNSLILWIDSEAGNEIMNHYFFGKIVLQGEKYTN